MKRLFPALTQLEPAILAACAGLPSPTKTAAEQCVTPYVCAMRRKCSSKGSPEATYSSRMARE